VEEVRIPSEGGTYFLSDVSDIKALRSGQIYVGQKQEARISVFDSQGEFLRHIGRRGYGPGEFQHLKSMGWLADTLWVTDDGLLRVSFFDTAGSLLRTARISGPAVLPGLPSAPDYFLADGSVAVELHVGSRLIAKTQQFTELPILRLARDGRILDTLARLPVGHRVVHLPWRGRDLYSPHPVPLIPFWAAPPNGQFLVFVDLPVVTRQSAGTVPIMIRAPNGAPISAVQYPFEPIDLPAEVTDSIVEYLARGLSSVLPERPPFAAVQNVMKEQIRFSRFRPPVSGLVVGSDSTIWLRREDTGGPVVRWDVLDWSGRAIGGFEAPSNLTVFQAERGTLWGSLTDENDVAEVVRYRVATR
jgi:hypothetical protein